MHDEGTIQAALRLGQQQLESKSETAHLDIQVLLAFTLKRSKAWILAHPEYFLPEDIQQQFNSSLERLRTGEPLPYVLGYWEFYGRRFKVNPSVLIPRPETEGLIELALAFIDNQNHPSNVLDVGTGSGCIAVTLAGERRDVQVVAMDYSREALKLARENAYTHKVIDRIYWFQGDLLYALKACFDLVVANLPYIPSDRLDNLSVASHEPRLALDGGDRGLELIKALIHQLPDRLTETGLALLEIDDSHSNAIITCANEFFPKADITLMPDLAGHERYVSINLRV